MYLTFDDGPDPEWTPVVLDMLADAEMRATFFTIGREALRMSGLIRRMSAEGHEVGNHTYSHRHPWTMTPSAARAEVRDGAAAIGEVLGFAPRFFRPPHGRSRRCMSDEAYLRGEGVVLWDVSAIDWGPLGRANRIGGRLAGVQPGDIVLMHDGRNSHNRPEELTRILPGFLAGLKARGVTSIPLGAAGPLPRA